MILMIMMMIKIILKMKMDIGLLWTLPALILEGGSSPLGPWYLSHFDIYIWSQCSPVKTMNMIWSWWSSLPSSWWSHFDYYIIHYPLCLINCNNYYHENYSVTVWINIFVVYLNSAFSVTRVVFGLRLTSSWTQTWCDIVRQSLSQPW